MNDTVVFGASHLIAELDINRISFIVDNNPDLQGTSHLGLLIKSPDVLEGCSDKYDVIVCSTSVREIRLQLESYGFIWGQNARVYEALNEIEKISELENCTFEFLVSSGLPSTAKSFSGGGIHLVTESGDYPTTKTIYEGQTHGLVRLPDKGGYAFTCQGTGVICLDGELSLADKIPLPDGLRPHGLRRYKDLWVVVCSLEDCIIGVDDNGIERFRYSITDKLDDYSTPQHHCNDLVIIDHFAYISMFSVTGNWKRGIFDGGLVEINLNNGNSSTIINNLTMPHSVTDEDGEIFILDSFKGRLLGRNLNEIAQLPGFLRGYDSDSSYYYLGESKNRNFSRMDNGRSPVSLDSKITIVDKKLLFCRSIMLPRHISEIHAILKINA
ncbi:TIGR03032 family protein [Gammaproteobacteria bacterium]|nr:TIGR03032 family protein [Gammaproteobacteria bacterium]